MVLYGMVLVCWALWMRISCKTLEYMLLSHKSPVIYAVALFTEWIILSSGPVCCFVQVACLLVDDPVFNRLHWPRQAELRINAMVFRPYGRNTNTKLGNNARDEPANAAHRCIAGKNRVSLSCAEDRQFCEPSGSAILKRASMLMLQSIVCMYKFLPGPSVLA